MNIVEIVGTGVLILAFLLVFVGTLGGAVILWEKSNEWASYWRVLLGLVYFLTASIFIGLVAVGVR